ncbi:MAG TPA: hypothetical protein VN759_01485, partial [Pseudolysinimonas sp.]|nr:hypothetical protein [Pseudolysinimonas sp.]
RSNSAEEAVSTWAEEELGGAIFGGGTVFPGIPTSTYRDCLFEANVAAQDGSAIFGAAKLIRCKILGNVNTTVGGTLRYAWLDRCTVVGNTPTGVGGVVLRDGYLESSILWANAGASIAGSTWGNHNCIEGGALGTGNIDVDPQFTDLAQGDLTLAVGSPCIDTGNPSAPLDADLTPADLGALAFTWLPIGTSYCSANLNSSGQTAAIAALGSTSVADDFLRVQTTHTAVDQLGLFMMSQNQGFVPFFNGSQGNLCVSAPIVRLTNTPGSVSSSGPQGLLNLRVGLTTLPAGLSILPGQTWHFQSWFRDNVGGNSTSNTSDAVSVTFQ